MIELLQRQQAEMSRLCRQFRVERLEVFGSAAGPDFKPAESDLDFIVQFQPMAPREQADAFFGLQEALEALLGRPVELIELAPVRNPYFLREIEKSRELIYAR